MDSAFAKEWFFNWTPSPGKPGLGDFLVFWLKYMLAGVAFTLLFLPIGYASVGLMLCAALMEEHGMITWMRNATNPLRAGLVFRSSLVVTEFVLSGLPTGAYESMDSVWMHMVVRAPATAVHFALLGTGYSLFTRNVRPSISWVVCLMLHLAYNGYIELSASMALNR